MKPARFGLLSTVVVFVGVGSFLAVWRSGTSLPKASPPTPSASSTVMQTSAAPVVAEQLAPPASAVPSAEPVPEKPTRCPPEPKIELPRREIPQSNAELFRALQENPEALGSASVGKPTRGSLFGGVELKESDGIEHAGGYAWGTELVIRSVERAVREVRRCFSDTPKLYVGDISREKGGWLRPHASHQSGLDVDVGYFYRTNARWYEKATAKNLDLPRTWALVRAFIEGGNVDTIFMDLTVQRVVKAYVATLPKEEQPTEEWFQNPTKRDTAIRHAWGHMTHFHVRFRDPDAVALGERIKPMLPRIRKTRRK
ncbi:MAG: penicillin-insensitive murein endopeptidase [Polyangiaceae bacterium]|nr:penicillin-insensitive murein endopeptidase [Polyangiaceae bacterium]